MINNKSKYLVDSQVPFTCIMCTQKKTTILKNTVKKIDKLPNVIKKCEKKGKNKNTPQLCQSSTGEGQQQ